MTTVTQKVEIDDNDSGHVGENDVEMMVIMIIIMTIDYVIIIIIMIPLYYVRKSGNIH